MFSQILLFTPLLVSLTAAVSCPGPRSNLAQRFQNVLTGLDSDHNALFSNTDYFTFYGHMDANSNNCVTQAEFVDRWTNAFHFSPGLAQAQYEISSSGLNTSTCQLDYSSYSGPREVYDLSVDDIVNPWLKTLIDYCLADYSRYTNNCDCAQLPGLCSENSYFRLLQQCQTYRYTHGNSSPPSQ